MFSSAPDDGSLSSLVKDGTNIEEAFRILDQEINKHKNSILDIMKRRNSFAPISRLPPEVLCRIFYFTSQDITRGPLHWIKVSHVSHRWRNTAVNSPSLWTNPPLHYARWTEEMLTRSKMASLTLEIKNVTSRRYMSTVSSVLPHISRTHNLIITPGASMPADMVTTLQHGLPKSAPRLESVRIHIDRRFRQLCFPDEALCETGHLRRLELANCIINWDSHLLVSSLTHLQLRDIPISARPTRTQFWNVMNRMPLLESLDLCNAFPVAEESRPPLSSHKSVSLERLRLLTITSSPTEAQNFLEGISFSPTATIMLACMADPNAAADFTGVLSAISSIVSPSPSQRGINVRTLDVFLAVSNLRMRLFGDVLSDRELSDAMNTPNLELSLNGQSTLVGVLEKTFIDMFGALPLGKLIHLRLNYGIPSFSVRTLAETIGVLPHLRSVFVSENCAKNLIHSLQHTLPLPTSVQRVTRSQSLNPPASFPSLRSITMYSVVFDGYSFAGGLTISMLKGALIWRYEYGAEIHELKIVDCSRVGEDEISELREVVVDVEWDGTEMGFDDEEESYVDYGQEYWDYDTDSDEYNFGLFG